jgi:hypothetical protein
MLFGSLLGKPHRRHRRRTLGPNAGSRHAAHHLGPPAPRAGTPPALDDAGAALKSEYAPHRRDPRRSPRLRTRRVSPGGGPAPGPAAARRGRVSGVRGSGSLRGRHCPPGAARPRRLRLLITPEVSLLVVAGLDLRCMPDGSGPDYFGLNRSSSSQRGRRKTREQISRMVNRQVPGLLVEAAPSAGRHDAALLGVFYGTSSSSSDQKALCLAREEACYPGLGWSVIAPTGGR